jgi:hypothetical protein
MARTKETARKSVGAKAPTVATKKLEKEKKTPVKVSKTVKVEKKSEKKAEPVKTVKVEKKFEKKAEPIKVAKKDEKKPAPTHKGQDNETILKKAKTALKKTKGEYYDVESGKLVEKTKTLVSTLQFHTEKYNDDTYRLTAPKKSKKMDQLLKFIEENQQEEEEEEEQEEEEEEVEQEEEEEEEQSEEEEDEEEQEEQEEEGSEQEEEEEEEEIKPVVKVTKITLAKKPSLVKEKKEEKKEKPVEKKKEEKKEKVVEKKEEKQKRPLVNKVQEEVKKEIKEKTIKTEKTLDMDSIVAVLKEFNIVDPKQLQVILKSHFPKTEKVEKPQVQSIVQPSTLKLTKHKYGFPMDKNGFVYYLDSVAAKVNNDRMQCLDEKDVDFLKQNRFRLHPNLPKDINDLNFFIQNELKLELNENELEKLLYATSTTSNVEHKKDVKNVPTDKPMPKVTEIDEGNDDGQEVELVKRTSIDKSVDKSNDKPLVETTIKVKGVDELLKEHDKYIQAVARLSEPEFIKFYTFIKSSAYKDIPNLPEKISYISKELNIESKKIKNYYDDPAIYESRFRNQITSIGQKRLENTAV